MVALEAQIPVLLIGICLSALAAVFLLWVLTSGRLRSDEVPDGPNGQVDDRSGDTDDAVAPAGEANQTGSAPDDGDNTATRGQPAR